MKIKHVIAVFMILFVIGCVAEETKEELPEENESVPEPQENIVIEVTEEVEEKEPEPVEEQVIGNIIKINDDGFSPENLTIYKGETVTWVADVETISNNQARRIACYGDTIRIFLGERLIENGQKSEFTFEEAGEYLCQEFIFGLRGNIKVKSISRPAITGAVVGVMTETQFLPLVITLALIFLGIAYSKKKKFF